MSLIAPMATAETAVTFRDLHGMAEFSEAEALQRAVWGAGDVPDPADLMMVIQAEGGLVGGAFVEGRLMGYVFAFPTATPGVQHSHRLAVRAEARGLGLGLRLKLYQRDWALARGIHLTRWTYDPLRLPNASLNIARLGASAGDYRVEYYGAMAGINAGLPSDRLVAEWHFDARPPAPGTPLDIPLPEDLDALLAQNPPEALRLRLALREGLQSAFAQGQRVTGFDKLTRRYLLSPAQSV
ncbi:MAG TPA: GNAT family N-acetyltransferase [Gemmobacter sp.]|nr:GNAT family N-acetyltransferase [Gemmobacter sp.]